ncbi:Vms1/Ankzf1 family peptidyl-tRNA hydrolase [Methanoplanus endosymbiosus]|uniref:Actinobacteria/chloroflexi VLRF1 release factor domain-containing protein n=1 Tax=Methanoplanus endosymbiosus TaxID=33865 RepID=A0A9E7PK15_9EURY|nr:Vms1/Ankzf1 family peptidyl-tRNA hydrolase [Methanoplanus endosymbiosus]UUX91433.1 hypothetical protein L6E24_08580 [Methanoplanus endosymbiosus]
MLDKFLGKDHKRELEALNSEIFRLGKENEKLRLRLSKREEKAAQDPAKIQELSEALNRAETKVRVLEHELSALKDMSTADDSPSYSRFTLSRRESLGFTEKILLLAGNYSVRACYLPPDGLSDLTEDFLDERMRELSESVRSDTGIFFFYEPENDPFFFFAVIPPFSVSGISGRIPAEECAGHLMDSLSGRRDISFVCAHAGSSFIGLASEEGFLSGKYIETGVKEKHSKGGWSQKRFERLREEDIKKHGDKVRESYEDFIRDSGLIPDSVVLCGEPALSEYIISGIHNSGGGSAPLIKKIIDAKPEKHAGERIVKEIWSSVWYRIV